MEFPSYKCYAKHNHFKRFFHHNNYLYSGGHNFFAIASRFMFIFVSCGRQSVQTFKIIFALLLFCFHALSPACVHTCLLDRFLLSI